MSESTRSRTNNSGTIVHEEIINLIESPELREHLLHNPQLLSGDHYMQIVGGAPVEITRKRELLGRLVTDGCNSSDDTLYWHYRQICIDYIDDCLNALKAADGNKKMLLVSEISFIDSEVGSAITHGPFPVASWQAALAAMKAYADKWSEMTDLSASYWMIELFDLANDPSCSYPYDGFFAAGLHLLRKRLRRNPIPLQGGRGRMRRGTRLHCGWNLWAVVQGGICRPAHAVQKGRHS